MRDARPAQPHTTWAVPLIALFAMAATWGLLDARNGNLRAEEAAVRRRAAVVDDVRRVRAGLTALESRLPEPGSGDAAWWRARLAAEAARRRLTIARHDDRPSEPAVGSFMLLRREISVVGAFESVHRFLAWVEGAVPSMRLERFEIQAVAPGGARATLVLLLPSPNG